MALCGGRELSVEGEGVLLSLISAKKAREQFSAEKNRKIYGGNRKITIKKMAGKHFPIGIGKKSEKMVSKKGPESRIPRNSGGIPNLA